MLQRQLDAVRPRSFSVCALIILPLVAAAVAACSPPLSAINRADLQADVGIRLGQRAQSPAPLGHAPASQQRNASATIQQVTDTPVDRRFRSEHVVLGIDCYGLDKGTSCERISERIGLKPGQKRSVGWSNKRAVERVKTRYGYAVVNVSPIFFPDGSAYVNIDVVQDKEKDRLDVRANPTEQVVVHSNLLELYGAFTSEWMGLFKKGINPVGTATMGFWSYQQPALQAFVTLFRKEVPRHQSELVDVMLYDEEPTRRRAAAGLLGYATTDPTVVHALTLAVLDPDQNVRSEAAHALLPRVQQASSTGKAAVEIAPILQMLALPSASDRSRAAALLVELAKVPELRRPILEGGLPVLFQMLVATWPTASQQAAAVLEAATGLRYGTDVERWTQVLGSKH